MKRTGSCIRTLAFVFEYFTEEYAKAKASAGQKKADDEEDDDEELIYASDVTETVAGSRDEIMDAGFVEDEDSPEGIFDYDDGMDAGDEE